MKCIATLVFALAAASAAQAQDKIHLKGSAEPIEGEIVDLSCKEVRYLAGGQETAQNTKDIREIEFDPGRRDSYDFVDGLNRMRNGDFDAARDKFEKAVRDTRASKPVKQAARFFIVRCTYELQEYDKAIAAAKQLRAEIPETFYFKESFVIHYYSARAKGGAGAAEAEAALKELDAAATSRAMEEWRKSGDLLRADLAEAKGDWTGAKTLYDRYVTESRDAAIQLEARLGTMRCMAARADWNGLAARADQYINEWRGKANPPLKLLVGAYLGKGRALLEGEKKNKDALLELLRAAIDIGPKAGDCREHEEALAYAAVAAARVAAEKKDDKDKKETYRQRALQLKDELNRKYGNRMNKPIDDAVAAIPK